MPVTQGYQGYQGYQSYQDYQGYETLERDGSYIDRRATEEGCSADSKSTNTLIETVVLTLRNPRSHRDILHIQG